jgi:hypothetical protein
MAKMGGGASEKVKPGEKKGAEKPTAPPHFFLHAPRGAAFQPEPTAAAGSRLHAPPLRARSKTAPDFHRAIIGHGPLRHQVDLRGNPPRKSYQACGSSRRILRSIPLVSRYPGIQFQVPTFP